MKKYLIPVLATIIGWIIGTPSLVLFILMVQDSHVATDRYFLYFSSFCAIVIILLPWQSIRLIRKGGNNSIKKSYTIALLSIGMSFFFAWFTTAVITGFAMP